MPEPTQADAAERAAERVEKLFELSGRKFSEQVSDGRQFKRNVANIVRQEHADQQAELARLRAENAKLGEMKQLAETPMIELIMLPIRLRKAMQDVAEFSEAHHGDQPIHELLHALRVDIPDQLMKAAEAGGDDD